jgi:hypothetical protein
MLTLIRGCNCRFSIVRSRSSLRERSTAAIFVAAGANWSVLSAPDGPCTSFSRAIAPEGLGPCASMIGPCAKRYVGWPVGSKFEFTILPTSVRTCTSCSVLAGARRFRASCDPSRASWPGGSRGPEGPTRAGPSSTASHGREWSAGAGTTGASGAMSFATKSRATKARGFGKPSRAVRRVHSTQPGDLGRDRLRPSSLGCDGVSLNELPMVPRYSMQGGAMPAGIWPS